MKEFPEVIGIPHISEIIQKFMIYFLYLRYSPTYFLAYKHKTGLQGGLTTEELENLPADFETVLSTYDQFGDIYKTSFFVWWKNIGEVISGETNYYKYAPENIAAVDSCNMNVEEAVDALRDYFKKFPQNHAQRHYKTLIMAIPLVESTDFFDKIGREVGSLPRVDINRPYQFYGERFQKNTLLTGLRLLRAKTDNHKMAWWRLGCIAKVSKQYSHLDPTAKLTEKTRYETMVLASLTRSMFVKCMYISEQAARGRFPCQDKIKIPDIDFSDLCKRLNKMKKNDQAIDDKIKSFKCSTDLIAYLRKLEPNSYWANELPPNSQYLHGLMSYNYDIDLMREFRKKTKIINI